MIRRDALALGAAAGIAACSRRQEPPPLRFDQLPPINLAIATFGTEERMQPVDMDFIGRRRSEELINVTREYLSTRILAAGGTDAGQGIIEEATVIEREQPAGGIITRLIGKKRELFGTLAVRVAVVDGFNVEKAFARARVEVKRPLSTGAGAIARDNLARELARDLVTQLDATLIQSVRENLGDYIATS